MDSNHETALIERFSSGDPAAFEEIFESFSRPLFFFVRKLISDDVEAEDIVSETFRKIWQRKEYIKTLPDFKAFMYITARNSGIDYLRFNKKQKESKKELASHADTTEETIVNKIVETELLEEIYREIENLPEKARTILKLHYHEGLSFKEISERLDISQENVRTTKFRALELLRKLMSDKFLLPILYVIYFLFC